MKRCTRCGVEKPLADFGKKHDGKDGLNSRCRPCANERKKASQLGLIPAPPAPEPPPKVVTQEMVLELRRQGLSVAHIAIVLGINDARVHRYLEGQPRRLRFKGAVGMEPTGAYMEAPGAGLLKRRSP